MHKTQGADRKYYKINYDQLVYIEGQKAYVTFFTQKGPITGLASLRDLMDKLPANQFLRIHKSYIVNIRKIDSLEGNAIEIGRKYLPIGKSYKKAVDDFFGLKE